MCFLMCLLMRKSRDLGRKLLGELEGGEDFGIGTTMDVFHSRGTRPRDRQIKDETEGVCNERGSNFTHLGRDGVGARGSVCGN